MTIRLLALDTSTEACSAGIWLDGKILVQYEECPQQHAQKILPMIERVLAESEMSLNQMNAIAFGCGPGSFTGVRIGIGVAQGLALGADLPMLPVSTLKTLAQGAYRLTYASQVLAAIDARMSEIYWGQYHRKTDGEWILHGEECVLRPEQTDDFLCGSGQWQTAGTGWQTYPEMLPQIVKQASGALLPSAEDILPLAARDWLFNKGIPVDSVEPTYLRNEVTWKKLPGR